MGWTVHYQLLRDAPLTREELAAVAALDHESAIARWQSGRFAVLVAPAARADRVVADGMTGLPMGDDDDDSEQLGELIERLAALVAGAELRTRDDFGRFTSGEPPLRVARGELVDPASLAPPPLPAIPPRAAALVADAARGPDAAGLDDAAIAALFAALVATDDQDPRRPTIVALLAEADPARVARTGFARYREVATYHHARRVIGQALDRLADPTEVVDDLLAVWRKPTGTYHHGDLPLSERFRAAIASAPAVVAQMAGDVAAFVAGPGDDDLAHRRAEPAVELLARARTDRALQALLDSIVHGRARPRPWAVRHADIFTRAHWQLARHGDRRPFATLLHFLATTNHSSQQDVLVGLARVDAERARPYVLAIADAGALVPAVVDALALVGGDDAHARLRAFLHHPAPEARERARKALLAAGLDAGPAVEPPPPEALIAHPDRDVRHRALRALHERKDPALMLSLCAAEELDAILRARTDDNHLPLSWHSWDQLLPGPIRSGKPAKRRAWAEGDGAKKLGPQVRLPAIEAVLATDAATVAATIPSPVVRLPDEELAALLAEEAALRASLAAATA